jgi:hypothetical protein
MPPASLSLPEPLVAVLKEHDDRTDDFDEAELSFLLERPQQACGETSDVQRKAIFAEVAALQLSLVDGQQRSRWGTRYRPDLEGTRQDGTPCGNPDIGRIDQAIIEYWTERARETRHPVLKARYADVVWDLSKVATGTKPSIQMAWQAIDSYIECGTRFPNSDATEDRLERALELALSVGDDSRAKLAIDAMLRLLDSTEYPGSRAIWLFDVLTGTKGVVLTETQQKKVIQSLEAELQRICGSPNPFGIAAKEPALRLAKHYERIGELDQSRRVIRTYGEAVAKLADKAQGLVAMHWLQDVYAAYLQFGLKEEAAQFQIAAKKKGEEGEGQMARFLHSFEIPEEEVQGFLAEITEGSLESSLKRLAVYFLPRIEDIERQLEELKSSGKLLSMISHAKMGENQVVARVGSVDDDPEGRIMLQMADNLKFSAGLLGIAIDGIREKYEFSSVTLLPFLSASPLFGADRGPLLGHALHAYVSGDHITAIHVLVPQIEHALRRLLGMLGQPTNKHRRSDLNVMVEKTLNDILENEQALLECLGEDVVIYLRTLLCDPRGFNLRNILTHGLMVPGQFNRFVSDRLIHVLLTLGLLRAAETPPEDVESAVE